MSPQRIQLRRTKGWRKPEGAVVVARGPGRRFGNPFTVAGCLEAGFAETPEQAQQVCVNVFREWLTTGSTWAAGAGPGWDERRDELLAALPELRGKDLACFCKPGTPCHADVLIELANR